MGLGVVLQLQVQVGRGGGGADVEVGDVALRCGFFLEAIALGAADEENGESERSDFETNSVYLRDLEGV